MLKVERCFSGIGKIIPQTASRAMRIFQHNIAQKYSGDRCSFRPGYTIGVNARTADMAERYIVDRAAAVAVIIHRSSYIQWALSIEDHVIETYIADFSPLIAAPAGTDDHTITGRSHYDITDYSIADFCARAQTDTDTRLIGGQYAVAYYNIPAVIRLREFAGTAPQGYAVIAGVDITVADDGIAYTIKSDAVAIVAAFVVADGQSMSFHIAAAVEETTPIWSVEYFNIFHGDIAAFAKVDHL